MKKEIQISHPKQLFQTRYVYFKFYQREKCKYNYLSNYFSLDYNKPTGKRKEKNAFKQLF